MAAYTLDINGKVFLDTVQVNKVNKYYTDQQEFLREPAVLSSRSKRGELLYLVTAAFDTQDITSLTDLTDTVGMLKAFPYLFIKSDGLQDTYISLGNQLIGDGYHMYALLEYEIEAQSDNQGVILLSMRLQPVNWRSLTKTIRFTSLELSDDGQDYEISLHTNPGSSNILDKMVEWHSVNNDSIVSDLRINSGTTGQRIALGVPYVAPSPLTVVNKLGEDRVFRISAPVSNSGIIDDDPSITKTQANASEISANDGISESEIKRVYVSYSANYIGGVDSAIQSIIVRRRNRFASQTVSDMVIPYLQYLGKTPSEILISVATSQDSKDSLGVNNKTSELVDQLNSFLDVVRSSHPYLYGLDSFRISNPMINLMGVEYVVMDGSQVISTSDQNNVTISNYTFLESDPSSLLERSKYINASKNSASGDLNGQIDTLLEIINLIKTEKKSGGSSSDLKKIESEILKFSRNVARQLEVDNDSEMNNRIVYSTVNSSSYKDSDALSRIEMVLKDISRRYSNVEETLSPSEFRILNERMRNISSGVNDVYYNTISKNANNKYAQEIVLREIKAEQDRISRYGSNIILNGEAAPDLYIQEIFKDIPTINGIDSWRGLSTLPFVYDLSEVSGEKLLALWNSEKDNISKQYEALEGYIGGEYGSQPKIPRYNGEFTGKVTAYNSRTSDEVATSDESGGTLKNTASANIASTGAWLPHTEIVDYSKSKYSFKISAPYGQPRVGRNGPYNHSGIDITSTGGSNGASGLSVRAAGDGVVSYKQNPGGYGYYAIVSHGNGLSTVYGHMQQGSGRAPGRVKAGDVIGRVGSTGKSSGAHLHYEVRLNGKKVNPVGFQPSGLRAQKIRKETSSTKAATASSSSSDESFNNVLKAFDGNKQNAQGKINIAKSQLSKINIKTPINGMTKEETLLYLASLSSVESGGKSNAITSSGTFIGWYQLGKTSAMVDLGLMTKGGSWKLPGGEASFLNNLQLQTDSVIKYTNSNIKYAKSEGLDVNAIKDPYEKMRALTALHLLGGGDGAKQYLGKRPGRKADGNGMTGLKHGSRVKALAMHMKGVNGSIDYNDYPSSSGQNEYGVEQTSEESDFEFNPIPWDERLQAESRIVDMGKEFSIGLQKLIPTYKVYLVYGNNENHINKLLHGNLNPVLYEIPSVRNIRVEMSNQENPVSSAYFEVLNSLNTSVEPAPGGRVSSSDSKADISSLGSDYANVVTRDQMRLRAGNKIQIRIGYGNDPNSLDIVFNGIITETGGGEVVTVLAEGFGRELANQLLFGLNNSILNSITDSTFASTKVFQVLKNANLEHFGRNSRLFGGDDNRSAFTSNRDSEENGMNIDITTNSLFDLESGHILGIDFMGPSDTVENYWLRSIDIAAEGSFFDTVATLFPFSKEHFFKDFRINNKTYWDTIITGRRLFPSTISLVKNSGARSTTFVGIKEQMMYLNSADSKLLAGVAKEVNSKEEALKTVVVADKAKAAAAESIFSAGKGTLGIIQTAPTNEGAAVKEVIDEIKESSNNELKNLIKDYYRGDESQWVPATRFHMFSSSYNILSNQMKLNSDVITGVSVEYGEADHEEFGFGSLSMFKALANGNLNPGFIKEQMYSDSTIESLGMAQRTAISYLLEELEKAYDGAIIITGNSKVSPGDYALINDESRGMIGVIKCREVQHVFTEQDGYITIITPGMHVEPGTHLYSSLYFKLAMFYSMVAESLAIQKLWYSSASSLGSIYGSIVFTQDMAGASASAMATSAINTTTTAITGWLTYQTASGLVGVLSKSLSTGAGARIAQSGIGTAARTILSSGVRMALSASTMMRGVMMAPAAAVGGLPAIVVGLIVAIAGGFLYNVYDRYKSSAEIKHRALMKFPVLTYGKEYEPGLYGWNDTESILSSQWENVKKTANNLTGIMDAAEGQSLSTMLRVGAKILND